MDIQEQWEKALRKTEIVRPRVQPLLTFADTQLPYIFLAEAASDVSDTVVRKGEVLVEKPAIVLPSNLPQFEGFESEQEDRRDLEVFTNFLFVRGVRFPSLKYRNQTRSVDLHGARLQGAIEHYRHLLEKEENVSTGLILGPEDCWQFSLLIFISSQVLRQAEGDIRKLLEEHKKRGLL